MYRKALEEHGRSDQVDEVVLRLDVHLAESLGGAREEAKYLFEHGYRGFDSKELQESLIVGGPEECIGYLEGMHRLGVTHVLFRCALDQRDMAMQTIRELGTEVVPHFRQIRR